MCVCVCRYPLINNKITDQYCKFLDNSSYGINNCNLNSILNAPSTIIARNVVVMETTIHNAGSKQLGQYLKQLLSKSFSITVQYIHHCNKELPIRGKCSFFEVVRIQATTDYVSK